MSKQRPDADKLANELVGASAFFRPSHAAPDPDPAATPAASLPVGPQPTTKEPSPSDVTTSRRQSVMTSSPARGANDAEGFDINRPTASRDSLRLSIDETKALDGLRQSLKWDYDLSVSKNDICRVALHCLLEDFTRRAEGSEAVKRLKRKQTGR